MDCGHHSRGGERKGRHVIAGQGRAEERDADYVPMNVIPRLREGEGAKPERLGILTWVFIFVTAHSIYVALPRLLRLFVLSEEKWSSFEESEQKSTRRVFSTCANFGEIPHAP